MQLSLFAPYTFAFIGAALERAIACGKEHGKAWIIIYGDSRQYAVCFESSDGLFKIPTADYEWTLVDIRKERPEPTFVIYIASGVEL